KSQGHQMNSSIHQVLRMVLLACLIASCTSCWLPLPYSSETSPYLAIKDDSLLVVALRESGTATEVWGACPKTYYEPMKVHATGYVHRLIESGTAPVRLKSTVYPTDGDGSGFGYTDRIEAMVVHDFGAFPVRPLH